MSLTIPPAYSTDKGSDLFGHGVEDLGNDFFDQFLTFSPVDNERPTDFPDFPCSTLQERPICDSQSSGTSAGSAEDKLQDSISESCENESLALIQNSTSSHDISFLRNQFYSESTGRAAISDTELLSLEGITLQSPVVSDVFNQDNLPVTPTPVRRRHPLVESISKSLKKATGKPTRSPIRKTSASPTMMCSSRYSQQDFDVWGQKQLQISPVKFSFDLQQDNGPLSPPPSARVSNSSDNPLMSVCKVDQTDPFTSFSGGFTQQFAVNRPADYHTPLATPTLEAHQSRRPSYAQISPSESLYPATPQFQQSNPWTQEAPSSEFGFGNSNNYVTEAEAPPVWWSHASTAPLAQPSPTTFHSDPQRATKSLAVQLQNELAYNANELAMSHSMSNGLMISMPEDNHPQQSFVVTSPGIQAPQGGYFGVQPTPSHASHPFETPTRQQFTPRQPYFTSPSAGHTRSRSGSSDSPSPKSASSPAFHVRKRRTPSHKGHEPRAASLGGAVDFVNFTPNDSKKILTGVAPSGSSKTKARREKEALEKRRRLSQAALRAVRAAGGSVESLVEEGLFV